MNNSTEQIFLPNSSLNQPATVPKLDAASVTSQVPEVENFSTVCRTCASVTEFVIPIFEGEGLQNSLADKIHKHLPIQVSEQDVLPRVLCYQCTSTLLAWHELVQCCVQADAALRARVAAARAPPPPPPPQPAGPACHTNVDTTEKEKVENAAADEQNKSESKLCDMLKRILTGYFPAISPLKEETLDMELVCQECMNSTKNVADLANHLQALHMDVCSTFKTLQLFIKNKVTFEEVLMSESSDAEDTRAPDSETTDNPTENLPYLFCPFCESLFTSSTRLIYHLNRHIEMSMEDKVVCCDETFETTKKFVEHLQARHVIRATEDLALVCRTCGHRADNLRDLQSHITETHDREKTSRGVKKKKEPSWKNQRYIPAVCPDCNKTFSNKYNMFVHMRSHHGGKTSTYPCDKCTKTYKSQVNLNNHKKLAHDGVLDFPCTMCGEAFPTRIARDVHARIHTGDTPFSCQYCEKAFRAKNTLDRHMDMHLDIRKYECHLCPKKFRKRTHLNYHLNTHKARE